MQFLVEPLAELLQIVVPLGVLLRTGLLGLGPEGGQFRGLNLRQALLPRQDVHGQFLIVLQVLLIHLVQHGHVFQQGNLMLLELPNQTLVQKILQNTKYPFLVKKR